MLNFIAIAVVLIVVGFAAWYVIRAKKKGARCIGCPVEGGCSGMCGQPVCTCGKQSDS